MKHSKKTSRLKGNLIHLIPRLLIIVIIGQTLPFKFFGAEESVWIFTQLNMEPYGRILVGSLESIAIVLLLTRFYGVGAFMTSAIVGTAFILHLVKLGTVIQNDGGLLFILSIIVTLNSLWLVGYAFIVKKYNVYTIASTRPVGQ